MKGIRIMVSLSLMLLAVIGCSQNPVSPESNAAKIPLNVSGINASQENSRVLWGLYKVEINTDNLEYDIRPLRNASAHFNILGWLEKWPCTNCVKITNIYPQPDGPVYITIEITHPFDNPNFTGFDVRGIAMFNGLGYFPVADLIYSIGGDNSSELLNADGFTTLYNPSTEGSGPDGMQGYIQGKLTPYKVNVRLSGYKRYISDSWPNARNMFFAGDSISQQFMVFKPKSTLAFSYAIDSCWTKATNIPVTDPAVDFPPGANCEEPWKIETSIENIGDGLKPEGGSVKLTAMIYDHQGASSIKAPTVECPDLFDGTVKMNFVEDLGIHSVWEATVTNVKHAGVGLHDCLVSAEDKENQPVLKPWLDLTAYQIVKLMVNKFAITDVTPPDLKDTLKYCYDVFIDNGYAYVTGGFHKLQILDVSVPENAFIAGSYDTVGETEAVVVRDNIAYLVANYDYTHSAYDLILLDITDPSSPTHISNSWPSGVPLGVSGSIAVTSAGMLGFIFHDIDPPETAHYLGKLELSDYDYMADILVLDGYAYALRPYYLHIVDFDPVETASQIGTVNLQHTENWAMDDWNNYLFIAGLYGVEVYDISDPASPVYHNFIPTDMPYGIEVNNGLMFISAHEGFQIWDVDSPDYPELVAIGPPSMCERFAVDGNYIYLARYFSSSYPFTILKYE